jgi:hypothetical protein
MRCAWVDGCEDNWCGGPQHGGGREMRQLLTLLGGARSADAPFAGVHTQAHAGWCSARQPGASAHLPSSPSLGQSAAAASNAPGCALIML